MENNQHSPNPVNNRAKSSISGRHSCFYLFQLGIRPQKKNKKVYEPFFFKRLATKLTHKLFSFGIILADFTEMIKHYPVFIKNFPSFTLFTEIFPNTSLFIHFSPFFLWFWDCIECSLVFGLLIRFYSILGDCTEFLPGFFHGCDLRAGRSVLISGEWNGAAPEMTETLDANP